ncbi:YheC/YheD family protein [Mangrovibacillus cuniculi]|uniref:YheC/YheD family protein n=1 Tax=Mangrovibacillus cuniculi TaxID=2593652 RepID=A0A7S8C9N0_9BACI|nr:YheC/YheD family protein [Mangrovibacillus cuniculi]QPC45970.1 YheC/YheD family protein [Mangrovibacillus cuniculi]
MLQAVTISKAPGKGVIYLPATIQESIPVTTVCFGSKSIPCTTVRTNNTSIKLTEDLWNSLLLPIDLSRIHFSIKDTTLHLGPLVGIFTSGFTPYLLRPIGERSRFFSKLLTAQKTISVCAYIFGEEHIDWENKLINGYYFTEEDGWKQAVYPFPSVIYDRLPNRKSERLKRSRIVKERMETEFTIPWYNPGFFDKLAIFERLDAEEQIQHYLPETQSAESIFQLEQMLRKYPSIYVKPIHGSLGKGIVQFYYEKKEGMYYARYERNEVQKLQKSVALEPLIKQALRGRPLQRFLVQQGIPLHINEGQVVDFRVHTNKDQHGVWQVTAIAAKRAGSGSATTHVKNGGKIVSLQELFEDLSTRQEVQKKLKKAALELSLSLERQLSGVIGEVGFDFGMDTDGRIWFFEANSKPGRSIFSHVDHREYEWLTRKLSLAFSIHVMNQQLNHDLAGLKL